MASVIPKKTLNLAGLYHTTPKSETLKIKHIADCCPYLPAREKWYNYSIVLADMTSVENHGR
jgi:hypothetical protein